MGQRTRTDSPATGTRIEEVASQRVDALCLLPGLLGGIGLDAGAILAKAGLAPGSLDNPDDRIPFAAAARLLAGSARASGIPHLGLRVGGDWTLEHMGALGQLMRHSPTLGDALRSFAVYHRLDCEGGAVFLAERNDMAAFGYVVHQPGVDGIDIIYDTVLACGWNFIRELLGRHATLLKVVFARNQPADARPYREFFRERLQFDCDHSALYLPKRLLDKAVAGADSRLRQRIEADMEAAPAMDLAARLNRALRLLLLNGEVSGDEVAQQLAMHRRTLHRRLKARGTTFQRVLDDVRWDVARQLLGHTTLPLCKVAAATGYADASTFVRAFHRWSGTTPAKWREAQQRGTLVEPACVASQQSALTGP